MLRETVPGRIGFTHRVLREYLAARAMVGNDTTELLPEFAHLDRWREVADLARALRPADEHTAPPAGDKPEARPPAGHARRHRGYSAPERAISHQLAIRSGMYEVLREAIDDCGVSWERCRSWDLGDGMLVVFPPDANEPRAVTELPPRLADILVRHNSIRSDSSRTAATTSTATSIAAPDSSPETCSSRPRVALNPATARTASICRAAAGGCRAAREAQRPGDDRPCVHRHVLR
ncbi:hypothetical protein ACFVYA_45470 [Amycolatopsis sp. NPDC058278]|uniref:hypothetical protein n=1 Tax=Amycolatopsis sp. NPDC058278 TaxID=3346417 RepID=UPI0036DF9F95